MKQSVRHTILQLTKAQKITLIERIQNLWNNYGTLCRVYLKGSPDFSSVIVKHIQIPAADVHPKGFTSSFSKQRKIKSYQVETYWYQQYNERITNSKHCPTPHCIEAFANGNELFLLLEDLATRGFTTPKYSIPWQGVELVLRWLAHFHAQFLHVQPDGIWPCGTYWHLDTRPEELQNIQNTPMHTMAPFIDAQLQACRFQTFVHGDAKLANFCFDERLTKVAAVDFQYVGKGCGMKDVAYFVGSCMDESACKRHEQAILQCYFTALHTCLSHTDLDTQALEYEWRAVYHTAWADFQRFLLGWSPRHSKNHGYSQQLTESVNTQIIDQLLSTATTACKAAGKYSMQHWKGNLQVSSKGLDSAAADIVTQVDVQAQKIILEALSPSLQQYDLGLLAEEGSHDNSRLTKHAFWAVDPLDGTYFFAAGKAGFATSIALVSASGQTILGVVYDPVSETLYHAVRGGGLFINGQPYQPKPTIQPISSEVTLYADKSLTKHPKFSALDSAFDIQFIGGAVMNCIHLLSHTAAIYCKPPRKTEGGCAIWDLAAVSLLLHEANGFPRLFDGTEIHLNRSDSLYFHDVGLMCSSPHFPYQQAAEQMNLILQVVKT